MKNGKEVYRGYCIPKDEENLKLIADIYDNWEFKRQVLPVEYVKEEKISSLEIADLQSSHVSELSKETIKSLFKTCKNEWESATYEQLSNDKVLGLLRFYLEYAMRHIEMVLLLQRMAQIYLPCLRKRLKMAQGMNFILIDGWNMLRMAGKKKMI